LDKTSFQMIGRRFSDTYISDTLVFTRACCSYGWWSCSGRPDHRTCAVRPGCCRWSGRPPVRLDFPLDLHGRRPQCLHGEGLPFQNYAERLCDKTCVNVDQHGKLPKRIVHLFYKELTLQNTDEFIVKHMNNNFHAHFLTLKWTKCNINDITNNIHMTTFRMYLF